MADTPRVYVFCDHNCKYEGLTKEQILTAIYQAVNDGIITDINAGFIQTIKTINNTALKFFVGSQSEYDALPEMDKQNLFAIITDDTTREDMTAFLEDLKRLIDELEIKHKELSERMLKVVTYTPTADSPLYAGDNGNGGNTFVVDMPKGKTLANLACVMVKKASATMVCMPFAIDGVTKCYGRGETNPARGTVGTYSCELCFEESNGKITGSVVSAYVGNTKFKGNSIFLTADNAYTGNDYITLYFY